MKIGSMTYIWTWLSVVVVLVLIQYGNRVRKKAQLTFSDDELFNKLKVGNSASTRRFKHILIVMAFIFICISFLQPKWGYRWEEIKRKGIDVIVALDLSKSMLAQDVKPSRLERAKLEIKNLINMLNGDRIGIVGFSGTAFVHCPLTLDYSAAKIFIDALDTDSIPVPGTNIGGAIRRAIDSFEGVEKKHRVLILITDGEDHEKDVLDAVKEAQKKGVIIHCVSIGSSMGAPIPVVDDDGNTTYLKNRKGDIVLSKMDDALLQKVALLTGGKKGTIGGAESPLEQIYNDEISKMEKKELGSLRQKRYENRYQWPLTIALLLLLLEMFLPFEIFKSDGDQNVNA